MHGGSVCRLAVQQVPWVTHASVHHLCRLVLGTRNPARSHGQYAEASVSWIKSQILELNRKEAFD